MKKNYIYILLLSFLSFTACMEDKELELVGNDIGTPPLGLTYEKAFVGLADSAFIDAPTLTQSPEVIGYTIVRQIFTKNNGEVIVDKNLENIMLVVIDPQNGSFKIIASPDDKGNPTKLPFGHLSLSISANYRGGAVNYDSAANLIIDNLPLEIQSELKLSADFPSTGVVGQIQVGATEEAEFEAEILGYYLLEQIEGFALDTLTGEIKKLDDRLKEGEYVFKPYVETTHGTRYFEDSVVMTVNPLDIQLEYGEAAAIGFAYTGSIDGAPSLSGNDFNAVTEYTYAFSEETANEMTGFEIDATTGLITRSDLTSPSGDLAFDIVLSTNLGNVVIQAAHTVSVQPKPALTVTRNGNPTLAVSMSPWNAVDGINFSVPIADLGLGDNLTFTVESENLEAIALINITENGGTIQLLTPEFGASHPEGEHKVDVRVSNAEGVEVVYTSMFTINIEAVWTETVLEDFSGSNKDALSYGAVYNNFSFSHFGENVKMFTEISEVTENAPTIINHKIFNAHFAGPSATIKNIPVDNTVRKMRVSYDEAGTNWAQSSYAKAIRVAANSYTNDAYVAAEWTELLHSDEDADVWATDFAPVHNHPSTPLESWHLNNISTEFFTPEGTTTNIHIGMFFIVNTVAFNSFAIANFEYSYAGTYIQYDYEVAQ